MKRERLEARRQGAHILECHNFHIRHAGLGPEGMVLVEIEDELGYDS